MTEQNTGLPKWFIIPVWVFRIYGAVVLAILSLFVFLKLLFAVGDTAVDRLNRLGILMQIAGLASLIPTMISSTRLQQWEEKFADIGEQLGEEVINIFRFYYAPFNKAVPYEKNGKKIIDKIFQFSRGFMYVNFIIILPLQMIDTNKTIDTLEIIAVVMIVLFLLGLAVRLLTRRAKKGKVLLTILKILFFPLYLLVDGMALPTAISLSSLSLVILEFIRYQTKTTLVQTLNRWTVPVIALGMIMEFISTYLK